MPCSSQKLTVSESQSKILLVLHQQANCSSELLPVAEAVSIVIGSWQGKSKLVFRISNVIRQCYMIKFFFPHRPSYCVNYKVFFKHPHCKNTWADQLDPQKPICVECQDHTMNRHGKCKGEGISAEITLWEGVDLRSCYGGWMKLGPRIPNCKCENDEFNNFIFV